MKNTKTKCLCGCGKTLYLTDLEGGDIEISTEPHGKKKSENVQNAVVINKKTLLKLLK